MDTPRNDINKPALQKDQSSKAKGGKEKSHKPEVPLRDYFASHASEQDIIYYQAPVHKENRPTQFNCTREEARYLHADAMLQQRKVKSKPV